MEFPKYRILFGLVLIVSCAASLPLDEWLRCTTLDGGGKYHLCWRLLGGDSIEFRVEVMAHGYVGFGLSPNGGMAGSDIVTGWVKNGMVHFQDRYSHGNVLPEKDKTQDWFVVSGSENDTHTTLVFWRKYVTCDKYDRDIDDSTIRVIYAYSDEDPDSEDDISYHHKHRGSKSLLLLRKPREEIVEKPEQFWDVQSPNFEIKSSFSTMYWCKIYRTPDLTQKHHIVLVEPLIIPGNEAFVHHIVLYECVGGEPEELELYADTRGHQCHHPNMPDPMKRCEGVALAWGVGGENIILPEHVGLPLEANSSKYYMMEIHYDNPDHIDGVFDRSGFRIYYTPNLRQYDAGTLMIGSTVSPRHFIPPGQQQYVVAGHSNPDCFDPVMPSDGIKFLGVFLHAHLLGRRLKARHFRGSKELTPLAEDRNYDFNYQEYRYFENETEFLQGDQITVECTCDSSLRQSVTFGGESTHEEMCIAFILYYPRMERFASVSVPKTEIIEKAVGTSLELSNIREKLSAVDWNSIDVTKVEHLMRYGEHDTHCYLGNGDKSSVKSSISYPKIQSALERLYSGQVV